ncbi:MAG: metallophosphoesterase, partial [Promethearchaeota archaeon]
ESFKNLQLFSATLDNLTPDSEYKYQITTNDSKSPVYQFSSPKNLKNNSEFNFLVVGDLHADQNDISKEIALIKSLHLDFPFIISLGDNMSRSHKLANWMRFWKQLNPITSNHLFLTCTGNHDAQQFKDAKIWQKFFQYAFPNPINGYYYKYQYGNAIFFFLDLYNAGKQPRIPSDTQINWLKTELELIEKESNMVIKHRILILHNSIYNTGEFGCDPDLEHLFYPIIEKFHINLVISGHAHIFESYFRPFPDIQKSSNKKGTTFIVNGGGGGKLDEIVLKNRKFPTVPYQWDSRIHQAKTKPFLRGIKKSRFRNDYAVINYQKWGKICHSFLKISIDGKKLKISAIDWEGKVIYEKKLDD